ncbi:PD-(D/E)XK nuclease-like domain-containing protein [Mycobacteroides abscessus]|uniref:PD-(D/E)XK nuclease-like domain-containing protein n=1 Tax=Mycobacteroides abscessus TaxID=36809 RepID=UPI000C2667DF|nr:PD-(D/E)XK nuclease-like domain-containing protein [Mycobacteroides abscessus]
MENATADGAYPDVPEEQYHADRASLSVSGAKLLLPPSCPAKFRWAMDNERKPKKEWDFGHVAHHLVLGKGAEFVVLDPAVHGLKADGSIAEKPSATAKWKAAVADARAGGLTPITLAAHSDAELMAAKVSEHPAARQVFRDGQPEVALYYTDPETGVQLRGRFDWLEPNGDIADYKTSTTANPAELIRKFWTLSYFMQAAWYRDLAVALEIAENPGFRFVVQEKEPPFVVTVVEYDDQAIAEGRRLNRQAVRLYADCLERGHWPGYSDDVVPISLPGWIARQVEAAVDQQEAEHLIAELEGMYQ